MQGPQWKVLNRLILKIKIQIVLPCSHKNLIVAAGKVVNKNIKRIHLEWLCS